MRFDPPLLRKSWHSLLVAPAFLLVFLHPASSLYVKMPHEMHQPTTRGMHNASHSSTTFSSDEVKPSSENSGWDVLYEAFSKLLTFNFCSSSSYTKYFNALPAINLSGFSIPPNTKILFYGNSFMHEVLNNIVVANQDILIMNGKKYAADGTKIDIHKAESGRLIGYLERYDFDNGATIIEVQNYQPLQVVDNIHDLQKFMNEYKFDIAFYMNPAPRCQFINTTAGGDLCECLKDTNGFSCDQQYSGMFRGSREDVSPLWDVISKSMNGRVYELEAWTKEKRTSFNADHEHTIKTYPILNGHACNTDPHDCGDDVVVSGHQCQPGRIAFISELVMAKVRGTTPKNAAAGKAAKATSSSSEKSPAKSPKKPDKKTGSPKVMKASGKTKLKLLGQKK